MTNPISVFLRVKVDDRFIEDIYRNHPHTNLDKYERIAIAEATIEALCKRLQAKCQPIITEALIEKCHECFPYQCKISEEAKALAVEFVVNNRLRPRKELLSGLVERGALSKHHNGSCGYLDNMLRIIREN